MARSITAFLTQVSEGKGLGGGVQRVGGKSIDGGSSGGSGGGGGIRGCSGVGHGFVGKGGREGRGICGRGRGSLICCGGHLRRGSDGEGLDGGGGGFGGRLGGGGGCRGGEGGLEPRGGGAHCQCVHCSLLRGLLRGRLVRLRLLLLSLLSAYVKLVLYRTPTKVLIDARVLIEALVLRLSCTAPQLRGHSLKLAQLRR